MVNTLHKGEKNTHINLTSEAYLYSVQIIYTLKSLRWEKYTHKKCSKNAHVKNIDKGTPSPLAP